MTDEHGRYTDFEKTVLDKLEKIGVVCTLVTRHDEQIKTLYTNMKVLWGVILAVAGIIGFSGKLLWGQFLVHLTSAPPKP